MKVKESRGTNPWPFEVKVKLNCNPGNAELRVICIAIGESYESAAGKSPVKRK